MFKKDDEKYTQNMTSNYVLKSHTEDLKYRPKYQLLVFLRWQYYK